VTILFHNYDFLLLKNNYFVINKSQNKIKIEIMKIKRLYINFCFFIFLFSQLLYSAKYNGSYYRDIFGTLNNGSKFSYSTLFENYSVIEELSYSSMSISNTESRSGSLSYFPIPQTISNLKPINISTYSIKLYWTAPYGNMTKNNEEVYYYILKYSTSNIFNDDSGFKIANEYIQNWIPLSPGENEIRVVDGFNPGTTYYFAIESVNSYAIRSEFSNIAMAAALVPAPPLNIKVTQTSVNKIKISWLPPSGFSTLIEFSNRFNPSYPYEIKNYKIFRSPTPFEENWQFIAEVSSDTLSYTDTVDIGSIFYYYVVAVNEAGSSSPSAIRSNSTDSVFFISQDKKAIFEASKNISTLFETSGNDQMNTYSIVISSNNRDINQRVIKSVEFKAYKGGIIPQENFVLPDKATIKLYYSKNGSEIIPSSVSDEKKLSMYYYNGAKWFQVFGDVDAINNKVELKTSLLGIYQLRLTDRTNDFSADISGLSNKFITPNNDGKNDGMIFIYDNPKKLKVKGKIFDLKGGFLSEMKPGPIDNSLSWDGMSNGKVVSGGVYIYQIEAGGKIYNGTLVVVR